MTKKYDEEPKIKVDLRKRFPSIADQGARPLCLAFATSDLHSFAQGIRDALSVEYLAHFAYLYLGHSVYTEGLTISSMVQTLKKHGQPHERLLPYDILGTAPKIPEEKYPSIFYADGLLESNSLSHLKSFLDAGTPLVLCIRLSKSFFSPSTAHLVDDDAESNGGHAVVALGYGEYPDGETCILIRNSWGYSWGNRGHAWLTETFIRLRLTACLGVIA